MATNKSRKTEKVLRIGIIQDHQMKNERLIFPGESVSIGVAPQNTFSYKNTISLRKAQEATVFLKENHM